jgi:hypothetical protein
MAAKKTKTKAKKPIKKVQLKNLKPKKGLSMKAAPNSVVCATNQS